MLPWLEKGKGDVQFLPAAMSGVLAGSQGSCLNLNPKHCLHGNSRTEGLRVEPDEG